MEKNITISDIEKGFIEQQYELQKKINLKNEVNVAEVKTIAGVDLAYWDEDDAEYAVCCIIVIDYKTKEVIEKVYHKDTVKVPYISGCLAFREIPVFQEAYKKLQSSPDVFFFDGNGYLHPRHMGLATHAGILIDKPSIGIAKRYCMVQNVEFVMPDEEADSYTDIEIDGEVYGRVLRTHTGIKPIFLSVGNKIDLETATIMTKELVSNESHVPLPTRLADLMTHEVRKQYQEGLL